MYAQNEKKKSKEKKKRNEQLFTFNFFILLKRRSLILTQYVHRAYLHIVYIYIILYSYIASASENKLLLHLSFVSLAQVNENERGSVALLF
jgi:hypothetical protein